MSSTHRRRARGLLVIGSAGSLRRAEELLAAHAALRPLRTAVAQRGGTAWRRLMDDAAAAILLADPAMPVSEAVEGTHVGDGDRAVPVGVLPDDPRAIAAAAAVQRRATPGSRLSTGPIALLSSREDHVRERAARLAAVLARGDAPFRDLPTGRVDRAELLPALTAGPGLVVYTGEGDARGWRGFGRIQSWELDRPGGAPMGALVSLSCSGSARLGSIRGLCEVVVEHGVAASAIGAISEVRREDDDTLGLTLAERVLAGAGSIAEAFAAPLPQLERFRISGDPLAPFIGARGSRAALLGIDAPAAGDPLAPVLWR